MKLIEREQQIGELTNLWKQVNLGQGRIALVSGEAGIGKTSLIERFTTEQGKSARVLWGACDALFSPQPLGPFIDIAVQLQSSQTKSELYQLIQSNADRLSFSTEFFRFLQRSAKPVLLVLEDLHWADEATLDVVKYLGRRIQHTKTLLILTYRDDEVSSQHPLWFLLGDFPAQITTRMVLPLLSAAAVAQLMQQSNRQLEALHHVTGGNPFFVTEILSSQTEGIPLSVRDAVLARVARLLPEAKKIVELASLMPGASESWLIQELLQPDASALDECAERGVLYLKGNTFTFRHELARQSVEDSLPVGKARDLHKKILTVLLKEKNGRVPLARLVHHATRAGDEEATLQLAPQAAQEASSLGAHREALSLYHRLLDYRHRFEPEALAKLLDELAYEYYLVGKVQESIQMREQAIQIWDSLGLNERAGDDTRWLSRLYWAKGNKPEAEKYANQAIDILDKLPPGPPLAMAYSNKSQLHMLAWEEDQALFWGNKAIALAEQLDAAEILVHALTNVGSMELQSKTYAIGKLKIEQALRIGREQGMHDHVSRCYANLASTGVQLRVYTEAQHWLEEGLAYTSARDVDFYNVYLRGWQAQFYFETGRWPEVEKLALEAIRLSQGNTVSPIPAYNALGHLKVRQGDPEAGKLLDQAQVLAMQTGELQRIGPLAAARAEAAWWQGDLEQVAAEAAEAYQLALRRKDPWILGQLADWMWRAGEQNIPLDRLAMPYACMIRGEWSAAALAWEQLGCPYEQATALAEMGLPAKFQALAIFEQLGARPAARELRKQLQAQGVKGIPPEAQPAKPAVSALLTVREREILGLMAEGLSNPAMAAKLTLSVGTVKAHTANIYSKLGVNNRVQAISRARELLLI